MGNILSDHNKFMPVTNDLFHELLKLEDKTHRLLRNLLKEDVINRDTYSRLRPNGSKPGIMYGLPKVHKDGCPLRPILSAIGTFNYNIGKYLVAILAPITTNSYSCKDTFSFVN